MTPRPEESPYTILGIAKSSDQEAIKKAYRKLALKWHPDKHQEDKDKEIAEKKFKKIAQAYEILSDEKKRSDLDRSDGQYRTRTRRFHDDHFRSPFDIFREFFGNRDPSQDIFFDDAFAFPSDGFLFAKHRMNPSSRVHIFYDDNKKRKDENDCQFSTVIRFSSASEPGKNASAQKTTTTTKVVDGKKIVTKRTEDNGKETVETFEDGLLTSQVVHASAVEAK